MKPHTIHLKLAVSQKVLEDYKIAQKCAENYTRLIKNDGIQYISTRCPTCTKNLEWYLNRHTYLHKNVL